MSVAHSHSSKNNIISTVLLIVAIAGLYFIFGLLGLELAVPPSQAGAIWPPAGIALAAMLLYGWRIWPGIFIGNFCISAWAFGFDTQSIQIYIATGTGGTLFAYVGSILIKKYANYPGDLILDKDIMLFLLLGGPVSCLIPATIGISAMTYVGIITPSEIPVNWMSWWVGDSIGVLIFTPIMLTIFTPNSRLWRRRQLSLGLPLIGSFSFVVFFFFHVITLEEERNLQFFRDNTLAITQSIKSAINDQIQSTRSIQTFYASSLLVTKQEFMRFTLPFLYESEKNLSFKFLEYKPNNQTNKQGTMPLVIKHHAHSNNYMPATPKLSDSLSESLLQSSSLKERPNIFISSTDGIVHIFSPVYTHKNNADYFHSVIVASFPLSNIIQSAIESTKVNNLAISIKNIQSNNLVFDYKEALTSDSKINYLIQLADQTWQITYYMDTNHLHSQGHWSMWWVLISGLLFTSLLGLGLLLLTGRYLRTEKIIHDRTLELLAAKNSAESANHAKNQFLSNISHELRTPLNGILGFAQLLEKKPYFSIEDKKQLNIISHCGKHLLSMIEDILDISRIETNKIIIKNEVFDFNIFIDELLSIFKLKAHEKQLAFSVSKAEFTQPVSGDKKRLNQIISNLLINAIKFTDSGSISLSISHENETLDVSVTDTGCGISPTNQDAIFIPFTQLNDNNFSEQGIGLGLTICHELTQLMHGTLTVESTLHKGSTFNFKIPLPYAVQTDEQSVLTPLETGNTLNKPHILIADDNEINLTLLSFMLEELNVTYDTATNGAEALALLTTNLYQLALIDLNMPILTGYEVIQSIRSKAIPTPAIAISAFAEKDKIEKARNLGFNDYLTKPVDQKQLNQLINHYAST